MSSTDPQGIRGLPVEKHNFSYIAFSYELIFFMTRCFYALAFLELGLLAPSLIVGGFKSKLSNGLNDLQAFKCAKLCVVVLPLILELIASNVYSWIQCPY